MMCRRRVRALRFAALLAPLAWVTGCADPDASPPRGAQGDAGGADATRVDAASMQDAGPPRMPTLNGPVIAALAVDEPRIDDHRRELEQREREAIDHVVAEWLRMRDGLPPPAARAIVPPMARDGAGTAALSALLDRMIPRAHAAEGGSSMGATVGSTFTTLVGGYADQAAPGGSQPSNEAVMGGKSGRDASFGGSVDANGEVTVTLETRVDIPPLAMAANSKVSLSTRALCPGPDGVVELTIRTGQGGHAGAGGAAVYDTTREAKVRAVVNDNAEIASAEIETRHGSRSRSSGKESSYQATTSWRKTASDSGTLTGDRVVSSSGDSARIGSMMTEGQGESYVLGLNALNAAERFWQDGGCVRIDASAPPKVSPGATTRIPVKVLHKHEGSEVAARVTADLTGGKAIDPREIARTAGTLVHDAPDEKEKSASIKLTAYSRRGKATLKLDISTGASAYRIEGGADEFHGTGIACDLAEPFVVSGSGVTVRFTPSSDRAGTYEYQGSMSGFAVMGSGTYSVRYTGDTAASMSATGPGSVETPMGTMTKNGSEEYTLTPMTDSSCD